MDRVAMELRLLGPVEAILDGRPVEVGGPRQRALLALLALTPGVPVPAGRIVDELWEGEPPPGAETTLRSYVSRLRRVLGADAVLARPGGYLLAADPEQVDLHRFERLLREGRAALAQGSAGLASERLAAALSLWRGPALGGEPAREAARLEELRLACREERAEAELRLGRHAALVPELQALVEEAPLRERPRAQLVLALYRSGRQADALAALREARAMLADELGLEPGEELRELERAILRHEVETVPARETLHTLPSPATSFVGRDAELREVERLLRLHRLVTLTGMGGSGKTRLALEAARRQVDAWAHGVRFVDLTALAAQELVTPAVANAVGAVEAHEAALLDHLRGRELLLVLDNCEHVVEAAAALAAAVLASCESVRILATSRVALAVDGEAEWPVEPLDAEAASRLFVERAAAVRPGDDLAGDATIDEICRELDRLPLAIELAAARAKVLSPAEIAGRLDDRLRFLRAWRRVADPRHRTLEATMDWSYDLLQAEEQRLLRRLAVFAGGATLDAVAAVCLGGDEPAAVELLGRLADASLLRVAHGEPTRYHLLETVRQYAAAKLAEDADAPAVRRAHAEHYAAVAEAANLAIDSIGRGMQRQELVLREQHNLRAALDWAADADAELGLRVALALENFWVSHAPGEGARRFALLLDRAAGVDERLLAAAWRDYGGCLDVQRRIDEARPCYVRSRELYAAAGDELGIAYLDFRLGVLAMIEGDIPAGRALWEASLAVFRRFGDEIGELQAVGNLGGLELDGGDAARGRQMVEWSIEAARRHGWVWWEARALSSLAAHAVETGDGARAERLGREYLALSERTSNRQEMLYALALLARAAALRGDGDRARALWSSVAALEDGPGRFGRFDRRELAVAMPEGPLPDPLPLEAAVALALAG